MFRLTVKILLLAGCLGLCAEGIPKPVAHWAFDEMDGKGIKASTGDFAGCLIPFPDYELIPGLQGQALSFGSTLPAAGTNVGAMVIPNAVLDVNKPFTVTITFKLAEIASKGAGFRAFKDLFTNTGTRGPGFRITVFYGMLLCNSGDGKTASSVHTEATKVAIPVNRYLQLAVTYDGKSLAIFLDGTPVASGEISITASGRDWHVGSMDGKHYALPGAIDDLAIYQCALSAEEIAELYLKGQL